MILEMELYQSSHFLSFKSSGTVPWPSSLGAITFKLFSFKNLDNFSTSLGAEENPWIAITQLFESFPSKYFVFAIFEVFISGSFLNLSKDISYSLFSSSSKIFINSLILFSSFVSTNSFVIFTTSSWIKISFKITLEIFFNLIVLWVQLFNNTSLLIK